MYLTWLDSNSWLVEMAGSRILIDPWLVGSLTFSNTPWLFRAERLQPRPLPENIDLILLSQGLEDHAHPPTLKALDPRIPVVASAGAARVATKLGFHNVTALAHGDRHLWGDVVVEAYVGAPTGPTTRENGYIVRDRAAGESFYYEPHGYPDPNLKHSDPVDLLLVPTVDLRIPLLGPVIQGSQAALQTVQWLRPRAIAPTAAGGELRYEGFLLQLLRMEGDGSTLGTLLRQHQLTLEILEPKPWERFEVRGAQKTPA